MKTFSEFQEGVASLAIKGGSKLIPALVTGIGAAGTYLQSKGKFDKDAPQTRKGLKNIVKNVDKNKLEPDTASDREELIAKSKPEVKNIVDKEIKKDQGLDKLLDKIRNRGKKPFKEEVAIANSMSGGGIAGSVEAGDEPPVNKRKKKGEPTIMARGLLPGARTRFKTGADLFTRIKKNKYT